MLDMRKISAVFIIMIALLFPAFAAKGQAVNAYVIPVSSPVYDYMDDLYLLCGMARPSTNRPWSTAEAMMILERIEKTSLDGTALKLYEKIDGILSEGLRWSFGSDFQMDAGIEFALEMYAHSNTDDFTTEEDWERSYADRKSLMRVHFEFASGTWFYTTSDLHYKWSRADYNDIYGNYLADHRVSDDGYVASYKMEDSSYYVKKSHAFSQKFFTSFFTNTMNFSFIWPKQAVFSLGGERWNLTISRDRLSMGNARFGNLLVDGHDFSDFARLTLFGDIFKYDWVLMYLNTLVSDNEQHATTEGRIFMIHTLQFRILNRISLTVSENVMYKYENFDLLYLNPAFIYHNLNNRSMFNALAYLELNAAILPGLEVYGQYAMDQARAPHEGESQSDSSGFVAGLRYTNALGNGVLSSGAEFAFTTPLLYRRDIVDFVRVNRYWSHSNDSFGGGHVPIFDYIGFPYGGDCMLQQLSCDYRSLDNWSASVFARGMDRGYMNMYRSHSTGGKNTDDANYPGKTPSGDVIKRNLVCGLLFDADLGALFSWPGVSFGGELDWVNRWDYEKGTGKYSDYETDVQFTLGVTVSI